MSENARATAIQAVCPNCGTNRAKFDATTEWCSDCVYTVLSEQKSLDLPRQTKQVIVAGVGTHER